MSVKITFVNGDNVQISDETYINAWNSSETVYANHEFHAENVFAGSMKDSQISGVDETAVGLQSILGSADWFNLANAPKKIYKTGAILSLETL